MRISHDKKNVRAVPYDQATAIASNAAGKKATNEVV